MGEVISLAARRQPRRMPPPAYRALVGRAVAELMPRIPPDDQGAAYFVLLQHSIGALVTVLGADEAAAVLRALADGVASSGDAG